MTGKIDKTIKNKLINKYCHVNILLFKINNIIKMYSAQVIKKNNLTKFLFYVQL